MILNPAGARLDLDWPVGPDRLDTTGGLTLARSRQPQHFDNKYSSAGMAVSISSMVMPLPRSPRIQRAICDIKVESDRASRLFLVDIYNRRE